jgi:RNA polymerase sigma factor (sigma-70 family)
MSGKMIDNKTVVDLVRAEHYDWLLWFCGRRLPTVEDAEDATQECFRRLQQRKLETGKVPIEDEGKWLTGTAKKVIWEFYHGEPETVSLDENIESGTPSLLKAISADGNQERDLFSKELRYAIHNVLLQKYPERMRRIFKMRYDDKSFDEISYLLGVEKDQVKRDYKDMWGVVVYNLKKEFGALKSKVKTV